MPEMPAHHNPLFITASGIFAGTLEKRSTFKARFVKAGEVKASGNRKSGIILEPQALEQAVSSGLFDNKAVFIDHAGFLDYPSVRNLVGKTGASVWNAAEQAVYGEISFYSSAQGITHLLSEILAEGTDAPDIGLSVVFWPIWKDRQDYDSKRFINGIQHVESVDIVFEPAADGRIIQALSTFNDFSHGGDSMTERIFNSGLLPSSSPQAPKVVRAGEEADPAKLWLPALVKVSAAAIIHASGLPAASQERLLQGEYLAPANVEQAVTDERAYLAKLGEAHVVQIGHTAPRGSSIQVGMDALEKVNLAADALLNGIQPPSGVAPLSGIRELYVLLSGDYEMTGVFHSDRVQLANVNSSTMAGMVANALNKVLINEFQQYPRWWEKFTTQQDFSSLQIAKFITLGGIGELPTVAEGAAYTELTWDDQTEPATFVKKGGYLGITIEAIDKDDTRRLQAAPRALAQAAWLTLGKAISAIFTTGSGVGPTMSDGTVLFHTDHGNLGTTALSVSAWSAVRTAMRKQTELNSGERLGALTAPKYILVPPDLEITALQVLSSEHDYSYAVSNAPAAPANAFAEGNSFEARMNAARDRVVVVDLWTDTNNWAAVADPRMYPSIGLGFRYGRTPEVFSVASPTAGLMFSNDTMPVKVRFFFATGPTDWRGLYKMNV